VIAGQELTPTKLTPVPPAVLAGIAVSGEEEGVGDLASEPSGDVYEPNEPNDDRAGQFLPFGPEATAAVCLQDFGLPIQHQPHRPPRGDDGERLERSVQRKAAHGSSTS
jgi:hypothetical protein